MSHLSKRKAILSIQEAYKKESGKEIESLEWANQDKREYLTRGWVKTPLQQTKYQIEPR